MRTLSHGRDLTLEQRKSLRSPAHEEEGMAETMCDELALTSILFHPCTILEEEVEKILSKASPRKKGWVQGKCFNI